MNRQVVGVFVVNGLVMLLVMTIGKAFISLRVNKKKELSGISKVSVN